MVVGNNRSNYCSSKLPSGSAIKSNVIPLPTKPPHNVPPSSPSEGESHPLQRVSPPATEVPIGSPPSSPPEGRSKVKKNQFLSFFISHIVHTHKSHLSMCAVSVWRGKSLRAVKIWSSSQPPHKPRSCWKFLINSSSACQDDTTSGRRNVTELLLWGLYWEYNGVIVCYAKSTNCGIWFWGSLVIQQQTFIIDSMLLNWFDRLNWI